MLTLTVANTPEEIATLDFIEPPAYFDKVALQRTKLLRNHLGFRECWVSSLTDVDTANFRGDVLYDYGTLFFTPKVSVGSYIHEYGHAIAAMLCRPKTWRLKPNFGCASDNDREEIKACYIQFHLMDVWGIGDALLRRDIICEYGFDMDLPDEWFDEVLPKVESDAMTDNLWKTLAKKGQTLVSRADIPIKYLT